MSIENFISTVWSESLLRELQNHQIGVAHCNRDYDGEIKEQGSVVKICGVGNINVSDYSSNTDLITQTLSDTSVDLLINKAQYFNFQIDDVDRAQANPKLMNAAMSLAASKLATEADKHIFNMYSRSTQNLFCRDHSAENIINTIIKAREMLYNRNVSDDMEVVFEITPRVATLLLKAKLVTTSNNDTILNDGALGSIFGCKIYVSNNVNAVPDGDLSNHKCFMRTTRAIAYAEQISEIVAYRPEKRFADAVKGLHLYGAELIYPKELVVIDFEFNDAA